MLARGAFLVPHGATIPDVDVRLGQLADDERTLPAGWQQLAQPEQGCDCVLLNPARPAFATSAARLAVGRWLRAEVARRAMPARWGVAQGWLPAFKHLPAPTARDARQPPRLPATVLMVTYELDQHIELAGAIADALRGAGSRASLRVLPAPVFARMPWRHDADLAVTGEVLADDLAFGQFSALASDGQFHAWLKPGLQRWLAAHCRAIAGSPLRQDEPR